VLNDGAFTASDAISIISLGMSNKAGQVGAAGKFGLGLKSIFHWAEAFFYFSPHLFPEIGQNQAAPCGLLNPWWSREAGDGRHEDWEQSWQSDSGADIAAFQQLAKQALNGGRWWAHCGSPKRSNPCSRGCAADSGSSSAFNPAAESGRTKPGMPRAASPAVGSNCPSRISRRPSCSSFCPTWTGSVSRWSCPSSRNPSSPRTSPKAPMTTNWLSCFRAADIRISRRHATGMAPGVHPEKRL
jgi:hypothetical protein